MGYTHYWKGTVVLDDALVADVQRILDAAPAFDIALAGPLGTGDPLVSTERIALNGDQEQDEDYETFQVTAGSTSFDFCKTARRPYDAVVGAILLRVAKSNPGLTVNSDGDPTDPEDWGAATRLYAVVFDEPVPVELIDA